MTIPRASRSGLRAHLAGTALLVATDETAHMIGNYMIADGGYDMIGA